MQFLFKVVDFPVVAMRHIPVASPVALYMVVDVPVVQMSRFHRRSWSRQCRICVFGSSWTRWLTCLLLWTTGGWCCQCRNCGAVAVLISGGGEFFGSLYTGAGPGGRVYRDTAPIIRCMLWRSSTKTFVTHPSAPQPPQVVLSSKVARVVCAGDPLSLEHWRRVMMMAGGDDGEGAARRRKAATPAVMVET